jgi:hypothetical protein
MNISIASISNSKSLRVQSLSLCGPNDAKASRENLNSFQTFQEKMKSKCATSVALIRENGIKKTERPAEECNDSGTSFSRIDWRRIARGRLEQTPKFLSAFALL